MTKTLTEYQEKIYQTNQKNGWFDDERQWGDDIALLHSEVSEAFEAYRDWGVEDKTRAECPHGHGDGTWKDSVDCHPNHVCKPQGFASELADVLVRLLDTCKRSNIDIEDVGRLAEGNHWTMEGKSFGTQMALLHKEISKLLDEDRDATFTCSFILSFLRDVNSYYGLDMYGELERKMAYNATRGYRHGGKRV